MGVGHIAMLVCVSLCYVDPLKLEIILVPVLRTELSVMGCKVEHPLLILVHSLMNWYSTLGTRDATYLGVC